MTRLKNYWPRLALVLRRIRVCTLLLLLVLLVSCSKQRFRWETRKLNTREYIQERDSLLLLEGVSERSTYGYTPDEPIKLGITKRTLAVTYPEKYFNSISGPNGEKVIYSRVKSCCPFKTVNSDERYQNVAVLEIYKVSYRGLPAPVYLYINFFDQGKVMAPKNFRPISSK